jgi:tRNA pseudouridine55 synthase
MASGLLLVDKPCGYTSFQVVRVLKQRFAEGERVGHGGTLDPFATGLLPVFFGREWTRKASSLLKGEKEYVFTMRFGVETDTCDLTGRVLKVCPLPEESRIRETVSLFTGKIKQEVPMFSAVKHKGKPLYFYARKGIATTTKIRQVEIYSLELIEYLCPDATLKVRCSAGTYVRTLARDLARSINSCAHLIALRRTRVSKWTVEQACPLFCLVVSESLPLLNEEALC